MKKFLNKKINIFLFLAICVFAFSSCENKSEEINGFAFDAPYSVKGEKVKKEKKSEIEKIIFDCDKDFDAYDEKSELSVLNKTKKLTEKDRLFELIAETKKYCDKSFDITVRPVSRLWDFNSENPKPPKKEDVEKNLKSVGFENIVIEENSITLLNDTEIELGAVAKGYCADRLFEALKNNEAIIDIGGTVVTSKKQPITVGVKNPDGDGLLCTLLLEYGQGISTSGSYERNFEYGGEFYHHILDPKTGYSVKNNLVSVTVVSESALKSDILSTKYFVDGVKCEVDGNVGVIFVTKDKKIYTKGNINLKDINDNYKFIGTK